MGFEFFPDRDSALGSYGYVHYPASSRNVLPRQVFRGHTQDCCGLIISKPVSLRVFSAIARV